MKARERILGRLEQAPRSPNSLKYQGETRQPLSVGPKGERLERFLVTLRQNGATVVLLEGGDDQGFKGILKLLKDEGVKKLILAKAVRPLLGEALEKAFQAHGVLGSLAPEGEEGLKRDALLADAAVSVAKWGIAEVGVLVLEHGPDNPRLLSLAAPLSVVVIRAEDILEGLEELAGEPASSLNAASQVTLISGPSQSADIQGVTFFGMHGPKKLIVAILQKGWPKE